MKTNRSARWMVKIRVSLLCLAVAAIAGIEFQLSGSLVSRFGQITASQSDIQPVPNVGIADFVAAAR
jgi:hypothetical protein